MLVTASLSYTIKLHTLRTPLIRQSQINNARSKFKLDERIPEMAQDGKDKLDGFRKDARDKIDQVDRTVEEKAAEAKGNVSGWFGGKK